MSAGVRRVESQVARVLGMDDDARIALKRLQGFADRGKIGVAGCFMPDEGVAQHLVELGIAENVEEADFFKFQRVVIPYSGIPLRDRRDWDEKYQLEDLTAPQVRRAQVALGLLRMEGARGLVIGRHEDPESRALADGGTGAAVLEDTTDTSRLRFSPAFGVVCQTTLSPRRVAWLVEQLRFRWRDARVTFLDTVSPAMAAREEALERLLVDCDRVVVVGKAGEASCEALVETAMRRSKPAAVVAGPEDLQAEDYTGNLRVALTAGAFAMDGRVHAVAQALARM